MGEWREGKATLKDQSLLELERIYKDIYYLSFFSKIRALQSSDAIIESMILCSDTRERRIEATLSRHVFIRKFLIC